MYILATLTLEQLISKVTLQQQRTHASYRLLRWVPRLVVQIYFVYKESVVNSSNQNMCMVRPSHIHRSTV